MRAESPRSSTLILRNLPENSPESRDSISSASSAPSTVIGGRYVVWVSNAFQIAAGFAPGKPYWTLSVWPPEVEKK